MSPTSNDESGSLRPLLWFILLTYAVTWVCLVPGIVSGGELTPLTVGGYLSGGFGPTIAALAVTYRNSGQKGVRALVARATVWRVPIRWWLVALFFPVLLKFGVLAALVAAGYQVPTFDLTPLSVVVATMVIGGLFPGAVGEELGWRGYALPRLQARYGMLAASILLGGVWAAWHIPTFLLAFTGQASIPAVWLLVEITAASVLYAWLVGNARWSVLLAIVFHASNNALTPVLYPAIGDAGYLPTYSMVSALVFVLVAIVLATVTDHETMTEVVAPIQSVVFEEDNT